MARAAFAKLAEIEEAKGNDFKAKAYYEAIIALGEPDGEAQLTPAMADKLAEYKRTGRIARLDKLMGMPSTRAYLAFSKVLGIGAATIKALIARRIYGIDDLRRAVSQNRIELNPTQRLGLTYYEDLRKRIPRDRVARVLEIIYTEIYRIDRRAVIECAGSYRRGLPDSGDIDILVAHRQKLPRPINFDLYDALGHRSDYVGTICLGPQRFSFLFRADWVIHVDVLVVPMEAFYAALLYFTGSQLFNIRLRGLAKKKGFILNQYGLMRTGPDGSVVHYAPQSEEEVFERLGTPWQTPSART